MENARVLVIGSGGREHVLCWKVNQSASVEKVFCAPGNGGTSEDAENITLDINNYDAVREFCATNNIDLVVPGNNKGKKSLGLFFWMLTREFLRNKGILKKNEELKEKIEDFTEE